VFDAPRNARAFFEALVADNLDLGRPENVELIFGRAPVEDQAGSAMNVLRARSLPRALLDYDAIGPCAAGLRGRPVTGTVLS
jgi:hypothetical protein